MEPEERRQLLQQQLLQQQRLQQQLLQPDAEQIRLLQLQQLLQMQQPEADQIRQLQQLQMQQPEHLQQLLNLQMQQSDADQIRQLQLLNGVQMQQLQLLNGVQMQQSDADQIRQLQLLQMQQPEQLLQQPHLLQQVAKQIRQQRRQQRRQLRQESEKRRQQMEAKEKEKQKADKELEQINSELWKMVKQNQWEKVVEQYKMKPKACMAKITRSGDTALHMAVSNGKESVVVDLVNVIDDRAKGKEVSDVQSENQSNLHPLKIANERGNIPLHLAASIGNVGMCKCLTLQHPELVGARNNERETPLFLAALHGKKDAFLFLSGLCGSEQGYSYCRRSNGETILHCAIAGEHFDLAYQILQHYKVLASWVNEKGLIPLHILASKPSAFRSGTHLSWFSQLIYYCMHVEQLHEESSTHHDFPLARRNDNAPAHDMENPAREEGSRSSNGTQELGRCHQVAYVSKLISKASEMLVILGKIGWGPTDKNKIRVKKQKNTWSVEIMNKLLDKDFDYTAGTHGPRDWPSANKDEGEINPYVLPEEKGTMIFEHGEYIERRWETPILIATKNGIIEMVEKILELNPDSILDVDSEGKNAVLLAVEHRQSQLYEKLVSWKPLDERAFRVVDDEGNSALHLAATLGHYQPYPFAALQMQWEIKWYKYVKNSVPQHLFSGRNYKNIAPKDVFRESHKALVEKGGQWLSSTSTSCSVVATLITTVAFATTANVPGGLKENGSRPNLEHHPGFIFYAISSLIGLSFSVTSVITFLAILTSRHHQKDFRRDLPRKLLLALTSLFISLGAMLVCFCAAHFFLLEDQLKFGVYPLYGLACLPVTLFALTQFPFFFDLVLATFRKVPRRTPYG